MKFRKKNISFKQAISLSPTKLFKNVNLHNLAIKLNHAWLSSFIDHYYDKFYMELHANWQHQ